MRVLHIAAANSTSGGGEKHVADCLRGMSLRGVELGLVAPEGGDLSSIALEVGAQYYPAPIASGVSAPRTAIVRQAIEDFKPDVVHAHGHRAALFARRADEKAGQRVVYTLHGIHVDKGILAPAKLLLERMLMHRTAAFVVTCKADQVRALRLNIAQPDKIHVVYNGIPSPKSSVSGTFKNQNGLHPDQQVILTVARISKQKNLLGLLRIFESAAQLSTQAGIEIPQLVMVCPGTPEDFEKLQADIAAHSFANHITLLPQQADLSSAYKDADVFALASLWEARAYVIVEALSYGTPVVGYDIDGSAEAVDSGKSGLLVPLGDEKAFAQALVKLLSNRDLASEYGSYGASEMMRRFSMDTMIDGLLSVYSHVQNK